VESYIKGTARSYHGGSFYHVERTLGDLDSGKIGEYIQVHKDSLLLKNLRRQFPELEHIPKSRMLFLDIENCGFSKDSPIISIALAHVHQGADLRLECLFARNPAEEKTILKYFLDLVPGYEAFFSYNGKAFDAPRIASRAIHNGLYEREFKDLGGLLNGHSNGNGNTPESKHHDLYHLCKQEHRLVLPDGKLKTIEKLLFGFTRTNDLLSEDIPKVYYEYVYGRKRIINRVIADRSLWKKCLKKAESFRGSNMPPEKTDERVRAYAQSLYDGLFVNQASIDAETGEFESFKGAYVDEYSPGERINEGQRKADMARLIHHNLLDTITIAGILCYLCSACPGEPIKETEKDALPF